MVNKLLPAVRPTDDREVAQRFDFRMAAPFCAKSVSEETRRVYSRVIREFFQFVGQLHPSDITPNHVLLWRDALTHRRRKAATITLKLTVVRSFSMKWSHGRWVLKFKVKGGRERTLPLPQDVRQAIDEYLKLDQKRRATLHSDGAEAYLFQPHTNYRTLEFSKSLSIRMAWNIVQRWASYGGIGKVSPHDLRRTAITKALDQGLSYRQVQMMSGHKDPKTV